MIIHFEISNDSAAVIISNSYHQLYTKTNEHFTLKENIFIKCDSIVVVVNMYWE